MLQRQSPVPPPLAAPWPLVGRDEELAGIARARSDAACPGVVLSAGAGIGKSRLAREAHAEAARDGAVVDWVQATSSAAAVPLGAFAGLIPDDVRSDDTLELMRRSSDALRRRDQGRRIVLGLDDAQLLDPVSAALVLHLMTTQCAFVVATVRSGAPCPDAIVSLWKDAGAQRMQLSRLSDEAICRLVETALGGPVEQAALHWVTERSRGNALYVRELVLGAVESGTLVNTRGLWRLDGEPPVSRSLADLVAGRMAGLEPAERAPLELLAVGEPLQLDEIATLSDTEILARAETDGLIALDPATSDVRLAHPIYGELIRAQLPMLRARELRRSVADVLQRRTPLTAGDALRIARLLLDAGRQLPPELRVSAARAANLAGDPDLGAQLARSALDDGAGLPAALLLARAHTIRKRYQEAEDVLASVAGEVTPDDAGVDYLEQRAHALFWGLDRPDDAWALLEGASGWSDAPEWPLRLAPVRAAYAGIIEGAEAAVASLQDMVADPALDAGTRRMAELRLALAHFFAGRTDASRALARHVRPGVPLRGYSDAMALGLWRLLAFETGDGWDELEADMAETMRKAVRVRDHEAAGHAAFSLGYLRFLAGCYRDADRWFAEAELQFEREDTFGTLIHVCALRVGAGLAMDDDDGTTAALRRMRAALGGRPARSSQVPYVARAEGWAARRRGDASAAAAFRRDAAALAPGLPVYAAQMLYEGLRAGAPATAIAQELAPLAERCDARLVGAYRDHAVALAAGDGAALLAVAEEMEAIGARRYALEAAADAARTFLAAGRHDAARRAAARAGELHPSGQGTEPPRIDGLEGIAVALTRREAQVAELAGRGLSSAEIADQLVLSVRTVESHVYRAMQKRGVSDRREL